MYNIFSSRTILALAAATVTLGQAWAQSQTFVLQEGMNHLPQYSAVTATFTPDKDCKVVIASDDQYRVQYLDQTYAFTYIPTQSPANVCEIDEVKAGSTITLASDFVMNPDVVISIYEQGQIIPVEFVSSSPAQGHNTFWDNNGLLNVTFNKPVMLSGAQLVIGSQKYNIEIVHVSSAISVNVGAVLSTLLADGTLKPDDRFVVTFTGICDAANPKNLYNGTGTLSLRFPAPQPQYGLKSATVNGQELFTSGLNSYTFLSYYAPEGEDGLFAMEFEADVRSIDGVLLHMGNRDLDAQGKYYEGPLPYTIQGNKILIDARGTLRSLSVLFPAVIEDVYEEGQPVNTGLGSYDTEHISLRVSNVVDLNGNYFRAQQAGNLGSYTFYLNYKELMENINFDGDNKFAGDEVKAGEQIRLWLGSDEVHFQTIGIRYMAQLDDETYEQRSLQISDFSTEPDPYQGIIITFTMPEMPEIAGGQIVRVSLDNATSPDGMPHDLSIEFRSVQTDGAAIERIHDEAASRSIYSLSGQRLNAVPAAMPCIIDGRKVIAKH